MTVATRRRTTRLLLVALGVLGALLVIELAVRLATGGLLTHGGSHADGLATDPMLGRVIVARGRDRHPTKGFTVTIGAHGTREHGDGRPPHAAHPLILAVGDSFAFGDGVSDTETWPAVLETARGERVVNAGMIGFGLDQAVLRAEQLVGIYRPDTIVVGFIPHDILRCEMSYWSGFSKPYFEIDAAGALRLHPAEVPQPSLGSALKRLLARSMTLDLLFPAQLHWQGPRERQAHRRGREVACLLMPRLADLARRHDTRMVVVAYPQEPVSQPDDVATKDIVLACAAAAGLPALDLFPAFEAVPLPARERLFDRHYTPEGYALVGREIAGFLATDSATATGDAPAARPPADPS